MYRRHAARVVTCLLALLALLALPSFLLEWLMVAFASVWFLAVGARTWKRRQIRCAASLGPDS